jgi:3',5'-cyclic AMP phosphodiesterase CpdA
MFVLAHLSDPHLTPLVRPRLRELAGKRAIGTVNWRWRRRLEHQMQVLDALVEDLAAQAPDHTAVTGDLVNLAASGEFAPARSFLARLGSPETVTFVPGNHDAYVRATVPYAARHWGDYMTADSPTGESPAFPFLRRRGPLALIGLSTAVPTGPFMAWGRLGKEQIERLDGMLEALAGERAFRVVLLHHPPIGHAGDRFKRLTDRDALCAVLRRRGADLVLHGHDHVRSLGFLPGPAGSIPVAGVPSASARGHHHTPAGYSLYRIAEAGNGWRCEMIARGLESTGSGFAELQRRWLAPRQDG